MATRRKKVRNEVDAQWARTAANVFAVNERINQTVIEHLAPDVWTAKPPGNVRTIAAIFTHMHNMRCKWLRLSAPHIKAPKELKRTRCTPAQARAGLAESAACCEQMLVEALDATSGLVSKFLRDGWARPWPAGMEMLCYMLMHEAHHRGQVCMLAHQLGSPLPVSVMAGMWNWEKIWKECGFTGGPGGAAS